MICFSGFAFRIFQSVIVMKSVAEEYYLKGLASLGKEERETATNMFASATEIYRGHLWAAYYQSDNQY